MCFLKSAVLNSGEFVGWFVWVLVEEGVVWVGELGGAALRW